VNDRGGSLHQGAFAMVNFFINRPVFTSAIAMIMVLAGAACFFLLPVSQFPEVTPPQIVVSASYPGASAQVVADAVTTPLEQQINGVRGMAYMSSSSSNDGSTITITFALGHPLEIAAADVQNRVSQAVPQLPPIVNQSGILIKKQNDNFVSIINLTSSDVRFDLVTLSNYAYLQIVEPLKRLAGVGDVQIFGDRRYSMRVWLDPTRLAALGLTVLDVQRVIAEQNVQAAAGKFGQPPALSGTAFEIQVNALGRLSDPEQFGDIVVRADPATGSLLLLRDVARIELGALQYSSSAFFADDPTIMLAIYQSPGSNAIELQERVKTKIAELSKRFPQGVAYAIHFDTTRFISASMRDVLMSLLEAMALVALVVYVFLQSWRAALIPLVAIPVSLIATLVAMQAFGFSLNVLSLLGMVLAVGLVVDDAIVVVENVERKLEAGNPPLEAAIAAMREVTGPIVATTAALMAVFVPIAFIPGVLGRLYNQFALTVAISVGISAFNSLTLSPALAAMLLRSSTRGNGGRFGLFNSGFGRLSRAYSRLIRKVVAFRRTLLACFALLLGGTWWLFSHSPMAFLPVEDQGYFYVMVQLPDGASAERTDAVAKRVRGILRATPGVEIVGSISGLNFFTDTPQSNSAVEFAILKPWNDRPPSQAAQRIVAAVRGELTAISEAIVLPFEPPTIPGLGTTGGFEFQLQDLSGRGPLALEAALRSLLAEARRQPQLDAASLFSAYSATSPQFTYDLDRLKSKLTGVALSDLFDTLQIYLGSLYVNDFNVNGRTFRVTLQAERDARATAADLSKLYVRGAAESMVPLSALGNLQATVGPDTVSHYNLYASALVNGAAATRFSSSQAIAAMERAAATTLSRDFTFEWTGITLQETGAGPIATLVICTAIVFVYLILAAQYESWTLPLVVLISGPPAMLGSLSALALRDMQIDVYSQIGFIMLIGLAAKNAILMVEFANRLGQDGRETVEAIVEAGQLRLRPILMTTTTFVLGVVPLMMAQGAGAAAKRAIGTTAFGGMFVATALSLIFVPVFHTLIEGIRRGRGGGRSSKPKSVCPVAVVKSEARHART
jgi:hydrophobe/amphiphile efflux-1 (HAE1) family protein